MGVSEKLATLLFIYNFLYSTIVISMFKGTLKRSKHTTIFAVEQKIVCT